MSQQSKGSSSKSKSDVPMDPTVKKGTRKKKSSKTSDSEADSSRENKNALASCLTISTPKTHSGKKRITDSVKTNKKFLELEEQHKKEPKKQWLTKHPKKKSRKTALSESATKDSRTNKSSNEIMVKWLKSPSENKPSTSKIRSPKTDLKNKPEDDSRLSVTPKKVTIESKHTKKRSRTKKEIVSRQTEHSASKEKSFKSSQKIMTTWLSPVKTRQGTSSSNNGTRFAEKNKPKENVKKTLKQPKKISKETDENLSGKSSQGVLSTSRKKSLESTKTSSRYHKKKPKAMTLKTLDSLNQDTLRKITMQQIFDPESNATEAPSTKRPLKTAAKENMSKPRKKRKKSPVDIDDLPTFQVNLPEQSESFKKYGVVIPPVKEILAERKELSIYKALVDKAEIIPLLPNSFDNLSKEPVKLQMKLLDCKHLSLEEIKQQFIKNKSILEDIIGGKQYSEKHQKFHVANSSLPYNPSNLVFTYQQINCMANLIREEFDCHETHLRYTFAVLIPELCLLVFMDTHKMTMEETVKYLDERPFD